jgi:hypothetical protein
MKKNHATYLFAFALLFMFACSFGQTAPMPVLAPEAANVPTEVPPVAPVIVETPTAAFNGMSISVNGTSFVIPQGLASGTAVNMFPASPPTEDMPYWEIYPAYTEFALNNYLVQNTFHSAKIIIYPANEYAAMHEGAKQIIGDLQSILANPGAPLPEHLPFLPLFNAAQMIRTNEQFVEFQNGKGIRYLTQYGQAPYPINNESLFYTFQGMTSDGTYYVAALLPINAAFLTQNGNPESPLPADGVPFDWDNFENIEAHFNLVAQKLNANDPNAFTPTLPTLDALIQSITAGIQ